MYAPWVRIGSWSCVVALGLGVAAVALAQDDVGDEDSTLTWFGDLHLRGDYTNDLPFGLPDEERARLRVRGGLRWAVNESLELGAAAEASAGTNSAFIVRINHDNERINDLNIDRLYARWLVGEAGSLLFGKHELPLELSPMLWDDDLRPIGAWADASFAVRDYDRIQLSAGYFAGDLLYDDESRVFAAQAAWRIREGADTEGSILLAFLDFDELDNIARAGLTRSNRRVAGRLLSDYRLGDLQLALRTRRWPWPLEARLDLVRNFGADDQRDGARFSVVYGNRREAGSWEIGYAYQRIQRDAVMAAFNAEDWWFHSAARGFMPWLGYGFDEHWSVRLAAFIERPDGRAEDTDRVLLDLEARW
jgi:hypothetical protein